MVTVYIDGDGEMHIVEKQTTYSVWWRKDPKQKMPSRMTAYSLEEANEVKSALDDKGWQAWWTLDED